MVESERGFINFFITFEWPRIIRLSEIGTYSVHDWSVERRLDVFERHPKNHVFLSGTKWKSDQNRGLGAVLEL